MEKETAIEKKMREHASRIQACERSYLRRAIVKAWIETYGPGDTQPTDSSDDLVSEHAVNLLDEADRGWLLNADLDTLEIACLEFGIDFRATRDKARKHMITLFLAEEGYEI